LISSRVSLVVSWLKRGWRTSVNVRSFHQLFVSSCVNLMECAVHHGCLWICNNLKQFIMLIFLSYLPFPELRTGQTYYSCFRDASLRYMNLVK
jgi:hypothetical protein